MRMSWGCERVELCVAVMCNTFNTSPRKFGPLDGASKAPNDFGGGGERPWGSE